MLNKSTLTFLKNLKKNNNREWFTENKAKFVAAKEDVENLAESLLAPLAKLDDNCKDKTAKECCFRIYKDVRFSKDKTPYKINLGANLVGRKNPVACYYLHIEPGNNSMLAVGRYMPDSKSLAKIRQEIDYNPKEFKKLISKKAFVDTFGGLEDLKLKSYPRGYKDSPNIDLVKYTSYIAFKKVKDADITKPDFVKNAMTTFKQGKEFNAFLNRALD